MLLSIIWKSNSETIEEKNSQALKEDPNYKRLTNSPLYSWFQGMPDAKTFTQQFLDRVKTNTTPSILREIALSMIATNEVGALRPSQYPKKLQEIDPMYPPRRIWINDKPQPHVGIGYGGGFGHWGLVIGSTNFVPETNLYFCIIMWEPGIYAIHTQ
jgi:hypothetical protein